MNADAGFAGGQHHVLGRKRKAVLYFNLDALGIGGRKVDLVDQRDDLEVGVHGHHAIGHRLSLHALRSVHNAHRAFAGGQAP